jgi:trehalose 6-phosphate synthase/phosphatase
LLDYDGTLVPIDQTPELARPTAETYRLLRGLSGMPGTCLAIISGRNRGAINGWFGDMDISLIAEHGAWIRKKGARWKSMAPKENEWKGSILPILERYVDRLPGSFVETKDYSLAWHYRKAETELGALRSRELVNDLIEYTANMNLQVLQGSRVIEVRHSGIDKGSALINITAGDAYDFILAAGDDWTDEDLFRVLPDTAYTIRVGLAKSRARFHLAEQVEVADILSALADLQCTGIQDAPGGCGGT